MECRAQAHSIGPDWAPPTVSSIPAGERPDQTLHSRSWKAESPAVAITTSYGALPLVLGKRTSMPPDRRPARLVPCWHGRFWGLGPHALVVVGCSYGWATLCLQVEQCGDRLADLSEQRRSDVAESAFDPLGCNSADVLALGCRRDVEPIGGIGRHGHFRRVPPKGARQRDDLYDAGPLHEDTICGKDQGGPAEIRFGARRDAEVDLDNVTGGRYPTMRARRRPTVPRVAGPSAPAATAAYPARLLRKR